MKEADDTTIMPFGKYKGTPLGDIDDSYFSQLDYMNKDDSYQRKNFPEIFDYIREAIDDSIHSFPSWGDING